MSREALTPDQRKGIKVSIIVVMLVLVLFVLLLLAGDPILYLRSEPQSVAYAVLVYVPVMAVCVLAYRRIR